MGFSSVYQNTSETAYPGNDTSHVHAKDDKDVTSLGEFVLVSISPTESPKWPLQI